MGKIIAVRNLGSNYRIGIVHYKREGEYNLIPQRKRNGKWFEGSEKVFGTFRSEAEARKEYKKTTPSLIRMLSAGLR